MAYYSVIKRNEIGSFGVTWMNPEPVLQSEIRKKKNKYHIFTHTHTHIYIYGIWKNDADESMCKRGRDIDVENGLVDTAEEGHGDKPSEQH